MELSGVFINYTVYIYIYIYVYIYIERERERIYIKSQKQPPEVFYKKAVIKNFAIFTGK